MSQDTLFWAQLASALAALAGMLIGLALNKPLSGNWLQTSRGGEYLAIGLFIGLFSAAALVTSLVLKSLCIAALFSVITLGFRRPGSKQAGPAK